MRKPPLKLCLRHNASSDEWIAQHNLKYYSNTALFCSFKLFSVRIVTAIETDFVSQPSLTIYQWKFHNRKMLDSDWSTYLFTHNLFGESCKAAFWLVDGTLTISTSRKREFPKWLKQYYDIFMKHFGNSFTILIKMQSKISKWGYNFNRCISNENIQGMALQSLKWDPNSMVFVLEAFRVSLHSSIHSYPHCNFTHVCSKFLTNIINWFPP